MKDIVGQAASLRGFNRFYTSAIGVLTDRYLGLSRPLGEARVIFEIGTGAAAVRDLRALLDLDSGYLSRLLHSLERQGLVTVASDPGDHRIRNAELTAAGRSELADLDQRAEAVAMELLRPLTGQQRQELIAAMDLVQRRLRLAAIRIDVADPGSAAARQCLASYADEIDRRVPGGFDRSDLVTPAELAAAPSAFLIAREQQSPVGCAIVRATEPGAGEIRHVWVHSGVRRLGLGRRLLRELEIQAAARGMRTLRLDTHQVLTEAISMYRTSGYREIPRYHDNPYAYHWFEKNLPDAGVGPAAGD
jgi:DNA-binding MarR family transcriptional regulator/GNAT superfamily N-acetyltransferase